MTTSFKQFICTVTVLVSIFITVGATGRQRSMMRIVDYNLLEGMTLDSKNEYENFINWVNEQNPDILALEETNGISEEQLQGLAAKWGHPYVATNCNYPGASSYPVAITSKYELEDLQHIVGDVHHGGIAARINGVEVVVLHLYPFAELKHKLRWADPQDLDMDGDKDGDDFRIHELQVYMNATQGRNDGQDGQSGNGITNGKSRKNGITNGKSRKNGKNNIPVLIMGDFNSHSPLDKEHDQNKHSYNVHSWMLDHYQDLLKIKHPEWVRTYPTIWKGWHPGANEYRIDYIYGSKNIKKRDIRRVEVIHDEFTENYSDHYPILLDITIN